MSLPAASIELPAQASGDGQVYLRSATGDILGWSDPQRRLQKALTEDDFLLYAQPIRALKAESGNVPCLEILLRLQEEEDNLLPPGGFFPVAEALDMLENIDRWVVSHTITWCARTEIRMRSPVCCINLSTSAVRNPDFAGFVRAQINAAGIPGQCLCFEINEVDALEYPNDVRGLIGVLRPKGCQFTIENFGSVRMSFAHIRDLPLNFLKVDSGIIHSILRGPGELARARAISATCRKLGIGSIAAHVETQDVLTKLIEIGFDYAQGFGIAQPVPLSGISFG